MLISVNPFKAMTYFTDKEIDIYQGCVSDIIINNYTVKYRQSAPPSRPFVVVLWRWFPVCRSYDTNLVHTLHVVQSMRTQFTFERIRAPHKKHAKCDFGTLSFPYRTYLQSILPYDFLPLAVKSRWGALVALYGSDIGDGDQHCMLLSALLNNQDYF